ncbi:MAG: three-Cys-motif partner protein TcmP [Roseomonas sp.]|nr:three-Cys-motif partner protein TcmP [Roseomonas sp.]
MGTSPKHGAGRVQTFGNRDTSTKQSVVVRYLAAYLRVMSKQRFHLSYVDAFAGSGARIDAAAAAERQPGFEFSLAAPEPKSSTALEALRLKPGFHRYVFGDLNAGNIAALRDRIKEARAKGEALPDAELCVMDANALVKRECEWLGESASRKAVVFLDPFGMQVEWTTLEAIARCPQIDVWLLVPTGIGVNRLLPWERDPDPGWMARMDVFYGTKDWRDTLLTTQRDLLGEERQVRSSDRAGVVRFTMNRLAGLFGGGLYPQPLALRSGRHESYHLIFANTAKEAYKWKIAHRIARHLIGKAQAGS